MKFYPPAREIHRGENTKKQKNGCHMTAVFFTRKLLKSKKV